MLERGFEILIAAILVLVLLAVISFMLIAAVRWIYFSFLSEGAKQKREVQELIEELVERKKNAS